MEQLLEAPQLGRTPHLPHTQSKIDEKQTNQNISPKFLFPPIANGTSSTDTALIIQIVELSYSRSSALT